jgi:hypothetical protein
MAARLVPISLRQLAVVVPAPSARASASHFVSSQSALRIALLSSTLRNTELPLALPVPSALEQALAEAAEAAATAGALDRLAQSCSSLSGHVVSYVDQHRDTVVSARGDPSGLAAAALPPLFAFFDRIQFRAMCVATIAAQGRALLSAPGDTSPVVTPPVRPFDLHAVVRETTAEVSAFCVEKYGVAPGVVEVGGAGAGPGTSPSPSHASPTTTSSLVLGLPAFARFAYAELLKNAMRAMLDRHTTAGVDDAPPIRVIVSAPSSGTWASVRVEDTGAGEPRGARCGPVPSAYFASSAAQRAEPNYQYSREFGVPFTGQGVGLVRARLHAHLHGGGATSLVVQPGAGSVAMVWFARASEAGDEELARML